MRSRFDEQLKLLNRKMTEMGGECESIIAAAGKALLQGSAEDARRAQEQGHRIDQLEREIESICLKLLLQQQPVARDLRVISAALKMITDMERIGDQAEDIAESITTLAQNTADGEYALDLLMIAKYFERIGDHAVNIAEWVEFSVTGEHKSDSMQ